jgi:hypothetical protein
MEMKPTHGGKRPNAGRKPGSTRGRNVVTRSISMPPEAWRAIDHMRGSDPRGVFIMQKLNLTKLKP